MRQTMLIADGDAELCDIYQKYVKDHGYDVETSSEGMDCMRNLRQVTPDVLVLDLELLWGGGDGVLCWLRDEPKYLPSRVLLTSAVASAQILSSLVSPPVVKALTKPFHLSALLDVLAFAASNGSKNTPNGGQRDGIRS